MKKCISIVCSALLLLSTFAVLNAQSIIDPNGGVSDAVISNVCGTMPALQQRLANDPAYSTFYNQELAEMQAGTNRSSVIDCDASNTITIPVAVHFDASFTCFNPECLVDETNQAIDALNIAFGDNTSQQVVQDLDAACPTGYPISSISTGTCINFCLGQPRGAAISDGIDPTCDPSITIGEYCGGRNYTANGCNGGAAPFWSGYLNIFVVDGGDSGLLGVADGIPGQGNADGVTVLGSVFGGDGMACTSGGPFETNLAFGLGTVLVHEVGHYLGLYHIWGDDGNECTGSDLISDTPNQAGNGYSLSSCPNIGTDCTGLPQTCGSYDYYHNFMDYSADGCVTMFTQEQAQVLNNTAFQLFGNTTASCNPNPLTALTTLCEQDVCNPLCDLDVSFTEDCSADEVDYTITVTINAGTGPFNIDLTADNDPSTILNNLDTGVAAGTYTYTFPSGSNANILVTDAGLADCFDGQFFFDPCATCDFDIVFDYDNVTCSGGLPFIDFTINNSEGVVWIDQDGNTTFDSPPDIDVTTGGPIPFPQDDITLNFYDGGAPDCVKVFTIQSGNYFCSGVADGADALLFCAFDAVADTDNYVCNGDGTATVAISVTNTFGNVTFSDASVTGTGPDYEITVPTGTNCGTTTVVVADDGSDIALNSGVEILSPPSIAGQIAHVGFNAFPDWGIDINTVVPCISGVLSVPVDGTTPESDFCEPTPPATPAPAQCASVSGNIAIIDRGLCLFTDKIENAQACGAVAVVICNCSPGEPNCNATDVSEVLTMGGASVNPITIPTVLLSYNKCQEIYAEMANGDVEMCLGAPSEVACERTIEIDACAFVCDDTPGASIEITDPCTCNADENVDLDDDEVFDLFYEVITITAPAGIADWVGVFSNGTPLDINGDPLTGVITDNGDGTYTLAFYLAAGDVYTANFTSASTGFDVTISGGGCEPCPLVPTLSQWGLIVLCLLLMCFGAISLTTFTKRTATFS